MSEPVRKVRSPWPQEADGLELLCTTVWDASFNTTAYNKACLGLRMFAHNDSDSKEMRTSRPTFEAATTVPDRMRLLIVSTNIYQQLRVRTSG